MFFTTKLVIIYYNGSPSDFNDLDILIEIQGHPSEWPLKGFSHRSLFVKKLLIKKLEKIYICDICKNIFYIKLNICTIRKFSLKSKLKKYIKYIKNNKVYHIKNIANIVTLSKYTYCSFKKILTYNFIDW